MFLKNSTLVFVRHGKTGKADKDAERQLTDEGVAQVLALKDKLYGRKFDQVITSSAQRTKQTAEILVGPEQMKGSSALEAMYNLPEGVGRDGMNEVFGRLLYAPLWKYMDDETGHLVMTTYGERAANSLMQNFCKTESINLLVVGHAIMINAILMSLVGHRTEEIDDFILDTVLSEAGAIEVVMGESEGDITITLLN